MQVIFLKPLQIFPNHSQNQNNQNNNSNNTNNATTKVASTSNENTTLAGGEGKYIDKLVKKICGKEKNALKKAKLIHKHLQDKLKYKGYRDSKFKSAEKAYKDGHLNCADTSRVTASMLRSAGVDCYVVHSYCHYYTVIEYKNKLYCSDATSKQRDFNTYWKGSSCSPPSGKTVKFKGKSSYSKKCGDNPCS